MKAATIFTEIQSLNPKTSIISSLGCFVSSENQQISDRLRTYLIKNVPETSLAYSILKDSDKFSEKQLWVISFELLKNEGYCSDLEKEINEFKERLAFKKAVKSAKRQIKTISKKEIAIQMEKSKSIFDALTENQIVKHQKFGLGKVISFDSEIIVIHFETVGEKKLLKKFTNLETL